MSAKAIREAAGKNLLNKFLDSGVAVKSYFATVTADTDWYSLQQEHPWLLSQVCSSYIYTVFARCTQTKSLFMLSVASATGNLGVGTSPSCFHITLGFAQNGENFCDNPVSPPVHSVMMQFSLLKCTKIHSHEYQISVFFLWIKPIIAPL